MLLRPLLARVALRSANFDPCQPCSGSLRALIRAADDRNEEENPDRYLRPTGIGGLPRVSSLQFSSGRGDEPISTYTYLNFETRSACSRMTRALSSVRVPVGSPL